SIASADNHAGRAFVVTRLLALGLPTPRRHRMRITLTGFAFATAVRVIDRIHHDAANGRANAEPAFRAGFTETAEIVFAVADFANGRAAINVHFAHFGRAQSNGGIRTFASREHHRAAGAACELRALTRLEFDAVNRRTDRDVTQLHRITRLDR